MPEPEGKVGGRTAHMKAEESACDSGARGRQPASPRNQIDAACDGYSGPFPTIGEAYDPSRTASDFRHQVCLLSIGKIGADQGESTMTDRRLQRRLVGDRGDSRIEHRDPSRGQEGQARSTHEEQDPRRGRARITRPDYHPRTQGDRRKPPSASVEDQGFGSPLRVDVGRSHRMEIPGRILGGGLVGRSGSDGLEARRINEALDALRGARYQQFASCIDVDFSAQSAGVDSQMHPTGTVDDAPDILQGPISIAVLRMSPSRHSIGGSPGSTRAGRRVIPLTRYPDVANVRATCPPTNPPAPVTSTRRS